MANTLFYLRLSLDREDTRRRYRARMSERLAKSLKSVLMRSPNNWFHSMVHLLDKVFNRSGFRLIPVGVAESLSSEEALALAVSQPMLRIGPLLRRERKTPDRQLDGEF